MAVSGLIALIAAACAVTPSGMKYTPRAGLEDAKSNDRFEHPKTEPLVFTESSDVDADVRRLNEDGYVLLGSATFADAPAPALRERALAGARAVGAGVVLLHAPASAAGNAAPAASATFWIRQKVRLIHFGANVVPVPEAVRAKMLRATGVYVQSVITGTPAAQAGIRFGDVILRISGLEVTDPAFLKDRIEVFAGLPVDILLLRDGVVSSVNVTLRP
jgi:hypothetical protein